MENANPETPVLEKEKPTIPTKAALEGMTCVQIAQLLNLPTLKFHAHGGLVEPGKLRCHGAKKKELKTMNGQGVQGKRNIYAGMPVKFIDLLDTINLFGHRITISVGPKDAEMPQRWERLSGRNAQFATSNIVIEPDPEIWAFLLLSHHVRLSSAVTGWILTKWRTLGLTLNQILEKDPARVARLGVLEIVDEKSESASQNEINRHYLQAASWIQNTMTPKDAIKVACDYFGVVYNSLDVETSRFNLQERLRQPHEQRTANTLKIEPKEFNKTVMSDRFFALCVINYATELNVIRFVAQNNEWWYLDKHLNLSERIFPGAGYNASASRPAFHKFNTFIDEFLLINPLEYSRLIKTLPDAAVSILKTMRESLVIHNPSHAKDTDVSRMVDAFMKEEKKSAKEQEKADKKGQQNGPPNNGDLD